MSQIKVAINGFGRIGRLSFREIFRYDNIEIVAINDLSEPELLAHLLKYDSAQGIFDQAISYAEDAIIFNGRRIPVYAEKNPADIPWANHEVDIVLECTGFFTEVEKAKKHIDAGAKRVIISAASKGDAKMIVYNVNHETLDGSELVISCASCTTNCLAPMVQVLDERFGIQTGLMNTVHAYTTDQNLLDGAHAKGNLRRSRAAAHNIVPTTTGAAKAISVVLPNLEGKLNGGSHRVPTISGSLTELYVVLDQKVSVEEVNQAMKDASNESYGYTEEELVSSDIIGTRYGSLFDATQTMVIQHGNAQMVKTVSWYDNEMSYVAQVIRTLQYFSKIALK